MTISILAKCDRCDTQFIIPAKPGDSVLGVSPKDKAHFKDGDKLKRVNYVRSLHLGKYDNIETGHGVLVVFCEKCDQEYWQNFDDAAKVLKSFWHGDL